jgi:hypothetical protein
MSWRFDSLFLQGIRLCVFPYRSDKEIPNRCWVNIVDDQVEHISFAIEGCQSRMVRTSTVTAGSTIWPYASPITPASLREACPMELLQMINGKMVLTRAVVRSLAKKLHSNVSLLTKLATEIKP